MASNNTAEEELDKQLIAVTEYVMKSDTVLKHWSRDNPGHFLRVIERVLEWHEAEATRRERKLIELFDKVMTENTIGGYSDAVAELDAVRQSLNKKKEQ